MAAKNKEHRAPRDALSAYWPQFRGRVAERWSRLGEDWLGDVDGRRDRLAEQLREVYGISEAEANRQVDDFVETYWGAISAAGMSNNGIIANSGSGGGGKTRR